MVGTTKSSEVSMTSDGAILKLVDVDSDVILGYARLKTTCLLGGLMAETKENVAGFGRANEEKQPLRNR